MRADTHPDHFNVLNSLTYEVVEKTKQELTFHHNLFLDMEYPQGKMVIHMGSGQGGKVKSAERFINNFADMQKEVSSRLMLENDDKLFDAKETLEVCQELKIPMVLDIHHHLCNSGNTDLKAILPDILATWKKEYFPPKIHISSPKEGEKDRKHADFIKPEEFLSFVELIRPYNQDIDVMIEAKQKDIALYKLAEDIKQMKPEWEWLDTSTVVIL